MLRLFSFFLPLFLSFPLFLSLVAAHWLLTLLEANAMPPHTVMAIIDFNGKMFEYVFYLLLLIADTLCLQTAPRHAGFGQVVGGDEC